VPFSGSISVGARGSKLSQAQVREVFEELQKIHPDVSFETVLVRTTGDLDRTTSLRTLEKTDFFTKEIDERQLRGEFRISVHSAKDLPDPLRAGLQVVALTHGLDPSDVVVYNEDPIPKGARIGTSSIRREEAILRWRSDLRCQDIRGTIEERLALLDQGEYEGVVIAQCALVRLGLQARKRMTLDGETAPLQGKLAVVARSGDVEMEELFTCIDERARYENFICRNACS